MAHYVELIYLDFPVLTINDSGTNNEGDIAVFAVDNRGIYVETDEDLVYIRGEDLFALREFILNEVPDELFVRPADPVDEPPFWSDGDIVEYRAEDHYSIFVRKAGKWHRVDTDADLRIGPVTHTDRQMQDWADSLLDLGWSAVRRKNA